MCQGLSVLKFKYVGIFILIKNLATIVSWTESCIAENAFMGFPPTAAAGSAGLSGVCRACLCSGRWKGSSQGRCPKVTRWSPSFETACCLLLFFPLLDFGDCQPCAQINLPLSS